MLSPFRAAILGALRSATPFEIPQRVLEECLTATPELIDRNHHRLAAAEADTKAAILDNVPIPSTRRPAALAVLGNTAEAVVESMLAAHDWQPIFDDYAGSSFGHGVDLLMLDPGLGRVVAIEVKSTIQPARWPRLASGRNEQLTPAWLNSPSNRGMVEWGLSAGDIVTMVAQVHFRRRAWRSCLIGEAGLPRTVSHYEQLSDLSWLS